MLNRYGIQLVADKKYAKLIHALITNSHHSVRMTLFCSFMELLPGHDGDAEFYLKAMYFLNKGK